MIDIARARSANKDQSGISRLARGRVPCPIQGHHERRGTDEASYKAATLREFSVLGDAPTGYVVPTLPKRRYESEGNSDDTVMLISRTHDDEALTFDDDDDGHHQAQRREQHTAQHGAEATRGLEEITALSKDAKVNSDREVACSLELHETSRWLRWCPCVEITEESVAVGSDVAANPEREAAPTATKTTTSSTVVVDEATWASWWEPTPKTALVVISNDTTISA